MTTKQTTLLGILLLSFLAIFPSSTKAQLDLNISVEPLECNSWFINIDGSEIPADIAWEIDGVIIEYTDNGYYLEVPPGESTTVCVTLPELSPIPLYCEDFEACEQSCPDSLWAYQDRCEGIFEIGSFIEGESVYWDFGDGTAEDGGHFITHTYAQAGEYVVSAIYTSPFCDGQVYDAIVNITACGINCEVYVEELNIACGTATLQGFSNEPNAQYEWYVDGSYVATSPTLIFDGFDEGTYSYCALYESPDCLFLTEFCGEVYIPGCSCEAAIGNSFTDQTGVFFLESFNGDYDDTEFLWYVDNQPVSEVPQFTYTFEDCEDHTVCLQTIGPNCESFTCIDFTVEGCTECETELIINSNNCYTEFIIEGLPQDTEVNWWPNDQYLVTTDSPFLPLDEMYGGWNTICYEYNSPECGFQSECIDYFADGCNANCEVFVEAFSTQCGTAELHAISQNVDPYYTWYVDGQDLGGEPFLFLQDLEQGWHYYCVSFDSPTCEYNSEYCGEFYVEACVDCSPQLSYDSNNCETTIYVENGPQNTDYVWIVNNQETFTTTEPFLIYPSEYDGWQSVCVIFESEECDITLESCTEFYVQGCNNDCEAYFSYQQQDDGTFFFVDASYPFDDSIGRYWYLDGQYQSSEFDFFANLDDCETHQICLLIENEFCTSTYCVEVQGTCNECGDAVLDAYLQEGCWGVYTLENVPENTEVTWTVNGFEITYTSSIVFEYYLEFSGDYEITATFIEPGCDEETTLSTVFWTEGCSCFGMFTYDNQDTDYQFYAYAENNNAQFMWFINGEYISDGDFLNYNFDDCGQYEVCLCTISEFCEEWFCEYINLDDCPCDLQVSYTMIDYDTYNYEAYSNNELVEVDWFIDGEYAVFDDLVQITYAPGAHQLCAVLETPQCPLGVEQCFQIFVEEPCDFYMEAIIENEDNGFYQFGAFLNNEFVDAIWYVNGEEQTLGTIYENTFSQGYYEICAFIETDGCSGIESCMNIYVPGDCEFEIYPYSDGGYYFFESYTNDPDATISWFVNDQFIESGEAFDFDFAPGEYQVCAALESGNCGVIWECLEVYVPLDCDFEVYPFNNGAYYGFETYTNDPDATISWYINDVFVESGEYFDYTFEPGEYSVCAALESGNCGVIWECFEVSIDDEFECELFIELEGNVDNTYFFYPDAIGNLSELAWYVDGEFIEFNTYLEIDLTPGPHTVCVYSEVNECQDDLWACIDVVVPDDNNCVEVTLWMDALGTLPNDLQLAYQIEGLVEELGGEMVLFDSCGETGIVLCVPDGCYNFSVELEEWSQIPIWVGIYIDGSLHEDFIIEPETMGALGAFGINTECETSIAENNLELSVYPNPANDLFNIDLSRWENASVQVMNSSGQLILNQTISSNKTQLDASSWASGVYFLQIIDKSGDQTTRLTKKISVQH